MEAHLDSCTQTGVIRCRSLTALAFTEEARLAALKCQKRLPSPLALLMIITATAGDEATPLTQRMG